MFPVDPCIFSLAVPLHFQGVCIQLQEGGSNKCMEEIA